jgi:hypothetical protein
MTDEERMNVDHLFRWTDPQPHEVLVDYPTFMRAASDWCHQEYRPTMIAAEAAMSTVIESLQDLSWGADQNRLFQVDVQVLYLCHTFPDLYSAYHLGTRGLPDQGMMLLRTSVESLLRVLFIEMYPGDWESAFVGNRDVKRVGGNPKGRNDFVATTLLRDELGAPELTKWLYGKLSEYVHSNRATSILKYKDVRGEDLRHYTVYPTHPKSQGRDGAYRFFINSLQCALYFHLAVHKRLLVPRRHSSESGRFLRRFDGYRHWCVTSSPFLAALLPEVDHAVAIAFAPRPD